MRQLTLLVVGLMLICGWAGLIRTLRMHSFASQSTADPDDSVKSTEAVTSELPALLPASRPKRVRAGAGTELAPRGFAPEQSSLLLSKVVPVAFQPGGDIGEIQSIVADPNNMNTNRNDWPRSALKTHPDAIYLTGLTTEQFDTEDGYKVFTEAGTEMADPIQPGTYDVAVLNAASSTEEAKSLFAQARASNRSYKLIVASEDSTQAVYRLGGGSKAPLLPETGITVGLSEGQLMARLVMSRAEGRAFVVSDSGGVVDVQSPNPMRYVGELRGDLAIYPVRIKARPGEFTITPYLTGADTPVAGPPVTVNFQALAGHSATLAFQTDDGQTLPTHRKDGRGLNVAFTQQENLDGLSLHIEAKHIESGQTFTRPIASAAPQVSQFDFELPSGSHTMVAQLYSGDQAIDGATTSHTFSVVNQYRVASFGPSGFGTFVSGNKIEVALDREPQEVDLSEAVVVSAPSGVGTPTITKNGNTIAIEFGGGVQRGEYTVTLLGSAISDDYGNQLQGTNGIAGENYTFTLGRSEGLHQQPIALGIRGATGKMVEYPPFLSTPQSAAGFNPNDRVETRVSRLYFFRDAHRVAQIINRMVESHNQQGVSASQTLARQARQAADKSESSRQAAERAAIEDTKRTREVEHQLSISQSSLDTSLRQLEHAAVKLNRSRQEASEATDTQRERAEANVAANEQLLQQLEDQVRRFDAQIQSSQQQLRTLQIKEAQSNENMLLLQRQAELNRVEQFRMEAALGHAEPDTYAPGKLTSIDPVAQVSVSVIGEGLLHLRGPLNGLNKVRMMIDQIDAPQGQVAIKVHSTQINGDEAEHLEIVANRIQTYIDQARFMTAQTAQMLRKSVVTVAARRAEQARANYPGMRQEDRDRRYLDAFFGADFIQELHACDSELLRTGNKLLSLHSMDVTSLSHALLLISLAKNSTRIEILQDFQQRLAEKLPVAEAEYLRNGIGCCTGGCKQGCKHHHAAPPVCSLAQNASFTSLRGFFDTQLEFDDTMTPMQREIIKLAQILRARLISENELKQRINDRSIVESRLVQSGEQEAYRRKLETKAHIELQKSIEFHQAAQAELGANIPKVTSELQRFKGGVQALQPSIDEATALIQRTVFPTLDGQSGSSLERIDRGLSEINGYRDWRRTHFETAQVNTWTHLSTTMESVNGPAQPVSLLVLKPDGMPIDGDPDAHIFLTGDAAEGFQAATLIRRLADGIAALNKNVALSHTSASEIQELRDLMDENSQRMTNLFRDTRAGRIQGAEFLAGLEANGKRPLLSVKDLTKIFVTMQRILRRYQEDLQSINKMEIAESELRSAFSCLSANTRNGILNLEDVTRLFEAWAEFEQNMKSAYNQNLPDWIAQSIAQMGKSLENLSIGFSKMDSARAMAAQAKQPLDHKKFLDMFIDEEEEQLIELLEGTRAHTANIDNYLKRITTALDDDLNTQFYYPALQMIRTASQFKRVEFGQTETTGVLTNNRSFGKVSPSASMEFDLPKRDILLKEAVDGILATYNDVGALLNDPNFLALVKMQSGASLGGVGGNGGFGVVQNVLPGLQSDSAEQVISRHSGASPGFGSELEKLMKDPAIYKFETGTGYEIRPVISPDGQAVVFDFHYLYTTQLREPVRADEKHLGRVKRHLIDTDVQLSNFEMREVSRYTVALKAERTARGVPLLEDIPLVGALWRPLPNREKSLQQNIILSQATIFPTLFDLMNLRWAPEVAQIDPLALSEREFVRDQRTRHIKTYIDGITRSYVDDSLGIPQDVRRQDLYSPQATIPRQHPNGYSGPGMNHRYSPLQEGHRPSATSTKDIPWRSSEGSPVQAPRPSFHNHGFPSNAGAPQFPPSSPSDPRNASSRGMRSGVVIPHANRQFVPNPGRSSEALQTPPHMQPSAKAGTLPAPAPNAQLGIQRSGNRRKSPPVLQRGAIDADPLLKTPTTQPGVRQRATMELRGGHPKSDLQRE